MATLRLRRFVLCTLRSPCSAFAPVVRAEEPKKPTASRIEKKTYDFKEAGKEMEYALFVPSDVRQGEEDRRWSSRCTGWTATRSRSSATPG